MTAISATRVRRGATTLERAMLSAASAIDGFVIGRLERRSGSDHRRAHRAQRSFAEAREGAQARGAIGLLPQ
jgi:hypothetical protein